MFLGKLALALCTGWGSGMLCALFSVHVTVLLISRTYCGIASQDDIYKPEYYCSLMEFRDLTLKRLQKYVQQRFFSVEDYLRGNTLWDALCHLVFAPLH